MHVFAGKKRNGGCGPGRRKESMLINDEISSESLMFVSSFFFLRSKIVITEDSSPQTIL